MGKDSLLIFLANLKIKSLNSSALEIFYFNFSRKIRMLDLPIAISRQYQYLKQTLLWLTPSFIHEINLSNSILVDDQWLNQIKDLCKNITHINLSSCPHITINGIKPLLNNTQLISINISWCRKISKMALKNYLPPEYSMTWTPYTQKIERSPI